MPTWDPEQYLKFDRERALPVRDLIARLDDLDPRTVVDLGCGTGLSTRALRLRWPEARTTGVDRSAEMLARARADDPNVRWVQADLTRWRPRAPVDLVFANAVLHWIPHPAAVFPRLLRCVAPGGVFAAQMPLHTGSPAHAAVRAVAARPRWSVRLAGVASGEHVERPEVYYRILAPVAATVELWQTEYVHVLPGPAAVVEWLKGTTLRPHLDRLPPGAEREAFLTEIGRAVGRAYPPQPDGRVLFPFRRQFVIARRAPAPATSRRTRASRVGTPFARRTRPPRGSPG